MSELASPQPPEGERPEEILGLESDPRLTDEISEVFKGDVSTVRGQTVEITRYLGRREVGDGLEQWWEYKDKGGEVKIGESRLFLWYSLPDERKKQIEEAGFNPYQLETGQDPIFFKPEIQVRGPSSITPIEEEPTAQMPASGPSTHAHQHGPTSGPPKKPKSPNQRPAATSPNKQPLNPSVTLDFKPETTPEERAKILKERLSADARLRGYNDLNGLELDVRDEEGSGRKYVITSASTQPVYEEKETLKRLSRPRIQGPLFKRFHETEQERKDRIRRGKPSRLVPIKFSVRDSFTQVKAKSKYENVGRLRLAKHGSSRNIDRRRVLVEPTYTPFVTVNVYDTAGDLITAKPMELDEFYKAAGAALTSQEDGTETPQAKWDWKNRAPEPPKPDEDREDIEIGLTRGKRNKKDIFKDITEQLERRDITNWAGLTWQLELPGVTKPAGITKPGSESTKRGIEVRTRTQQIIEDRTVKEREFGKDEDSYVRRFVLRTTEEYEDGEKIVVDERSLKDHELWHFFENPEDFPDILPDPDMNLKKAELWHMRLPGAGALKDKVAREQEEQQKKKLSIAYGLKRGANGFIISSSGEVDHDKRWPSLEEALGFISMHGHRYPNSEAGYEALSSHIALAMEGEERALGEELQRVLQEEGMQYFEGAVDKIYNRALPQIFALNELGLEGLETEDSWIVEALLERSSRERANGSYPPFRTVLESPHLVRSIVDEHVGFIFSQKSVLGRKVAEQQGTDDDGKPKIAEKIVHEFDEKLFKEVALRPTQNLRGQGSYGVTKGMREWHDKVWGTIKNQARKIYEARYGESGEERNTIDYEEYERLGRLLRRTIGQ